MLVYSTVDFDSISIIWLIHLRREFEYSIGDLKSHSLYLRLSSYCQIYL